MNSNNYNQPKDVAAVEAFKSFATSKLMFIFTVLATILAAVFMFFGGLFTMFKGGEGIFTFIGLLSIIGLWVIRSGASNNLRTARGGITVIFVNCILAIISASSMVLGGLSLFAGSSALSVIPELNQEEIRLLKDLFNIMGLAMIILGISMLFYYINLLNITKRFKNELLDGTRNSKGLGAQAVFTIIMTVSIIISLILIKAQLFKIIEYGMNILNDPDFNRVFGKILESVNQFSVFALFLSIIYVAFNIFVAVMFIKFKHHLDNIKDLPQSNEPDQSTDDFEFPRVDN